MTDLSCLDKDKEECYDLYALSKSLNIKLTITATKNEDTEDQQKTTSTTNHVMFQLKEQEEQLTWRMHPLSTLRLESAMGFSESTFQKKELIKAISIDVD